LGGRNQNQTVELVLLISVLRGEQMSEVHGIKTPAKKTNFHAPHRG
jgi:hypothetical protein